MPQNTNTMTNTQKNTEKRQQFDYWEVVNIDVETNEILMLDYLFEHSPDFKGATGTRFEPVTKAEYRDRLSKDSVIDNIIDCGLVTENKQRPDITRKMAEVYYKEMKSAGELEDFMFDTSYREHWDKLRSYGFPVSKYPIFNCTGGGRCFEKDFKGNTNPELSELIRKYESE